MLHLRTPVLSIARRFKRSFVKQARAQLNREALILVKRNEARSIVRQVAAIRQLPGRTVGVVIAFMGMR
ncbi:hypothetical protein CS343_02650 [Bordetella bronchiseptica]|nr:hypothetical protein CS343_02650 [Bordetella bronchiseptica]